MRTMNSGVMKRKHVNRGFTLGKLLIVVAIITVLVVELISIFSALPEISMDWLDAYSMKEILHMVQTYLMSN